MVAPIDPETMRCKICAYFHNARKLCMRFPQSIPKEDDDLCAEFSEKLNPVVREKEKTRSQK